MEEIEYNFKPANKCEVEYFSEGGGIQYIVIFDWNFGRWDYEGGLEVEVYFNDSFKEMDGIKSYFEPKESQVKEMIDFIQEKILEDPNEFGFEGHVEDYGNYSEEPFDY